MKKNLLCFVFISLFVVAAACSGGNDGGNGNVTSNSAPVANAGVDRTIRQDAVVVLNGAQSSDPDGDAITFDWQITSKPEGSSIVFSNTDTVTPSFQADKVGTYVIRLVVNDGQTDSEPDAMTLRVEAAQEPGNGSNQPPTADAGNDRKMTVYAYVELDGEDSADPDGDDLYYSWRFVSKPARSQALLFDENAEVSNFTPDAPGTYVIELVVSDGYVSSEADTVEVSAVEVFAANPDALYADVLNTCINPNTVDNSCRLSKLPLIGQENDDPAIADIMDRVVVSHEWMADRFEALLEALPEAILPLFKPLTAIYIACDIRPSFYWGYTGALYIDPRYIWTTIEEKDTIDREPDYRGEYGKELNYVTPWRYVKNNSYVYWSYDWDATEDREIDDFIYFFAHLIFHELAHANDFIPSHKIQQIPSYLTFYETVLSLEGQRCSDIVTENYPLTSQMLLGLAEVNYYGAEATAEQIALTPEDVAGEFENDRANDAYNYSTIREDVAMFFEEVAMHYFFDIERDFAITNYPKYDYVTAYDYIVTWGQRKRIADPAVKEKAQFIAESILPEIDFDNYFQNIGEPIQMIAGLNWVDNLFISPEFVQLRTKAERRERAGRRKVDFLPLYK